MQREERLETIPQTMMERARKAVGNVIFALKHDFILRSKDAIKRSLWIIHATILGNKDLSFNHLFWKAMACHLLPLQLLLAKY